MSSNSHYCDNYGTDLVGFSNQSFDQYVLQNNVVSETNQQQQGQRSMSVSVPNMSQQVVYRPPGVAQQQSSSSSSVPLHHHCYIGSSNYSSYVDAILEGDLTATATSNRRGWAADRSGGGHLTSYRPGSLLNRSKDLSMAPSSTLYDYATITSVGGGGYTSSSSGGPGTLSSITTSYRKFTSTAFNSSADGNGSAQRDDKYCGVCGDRALSYNFDAISCESCKAFFRRNAPKGLENFKCPYDGRCRMDVSNRRFCKFCRLKKCFDIGMRKEYILSDEEKAQKRLKIEANRQMRAKADGSRKQQAALQHAPAVPTDARVENIVVSSTFIPLCEAAVLTSKNESQSISDYDDSLSPTTGPFCSTASYQISGPEVTSQTVALVPNDTYAIDELIAAYRYSLESSHLNSFGDNLIPQGTYVYSDSFHDCLGAGIAGGQGDVADGFATWMQQSSVVTTDAVTEPIGNFQVPIKTPTYSSLTDLVNTADLSMRRAIALTKQVTSFRRLPQSDQIQLLKSGSIEILILRSALAFDVKKQHFLDPCDDEGSSAMTLDQLRQVEQALFDNGNVGDVASCANPANEDLIRFVRSLVIDLRADEATLVLLLIVSLFSPDRGVTLTCRDLVAFEQERYLLLLKRYLESQLAAHPARLAFARLVMKLVELRTIADEYSTVLLQLSPEGILPLMKEVLDLKPPPPTSLASTKVAPEQQLAAVVQGMMV